MMMLSVSIALSKDRLNFRCSLSIYDDFMRWFDDHSCRDLLYLFYVIVRRIGAPPGTVSLYEAWADPDDPLDLVNRSIGAFIKVFYIRSGYSKYVTRWNDCADDHPAVCFVDRLCPA